MKRYLSILIALSFLAFVPRIAAASSFVYSVDDGTFEDGWSYTAGNDVMLGNLFTAVAGNHVLESLSFFWDARAVVGTAVTMGVFDDPNDDGSLVDAVLLTSVNTVLAPGDLGTFRTYSIPLTGVSGLFYVAMYVENGPGGFIIGADTTPPLSGSGRGVQFNFTFLQGPSIVVPLQGAEAAVRATAQTPEPTTLALLGAGLVGLARRRVRRTARP